ncbi:MAG: hypothetical protein WAK88_10525, partial [Candidatus Cybelea sp.]
MMTLITLSATMSSTEYPSAIRHFRDMERLQVTRAKGIETVVRGFEATDMGDEKAATFSSQPRMAASKLCFLEKVQQQERSMDAERR